jgi:hypothetical protein
MRSRSRQPLCQNRGRLSKISTALPIESENGAMTRFGAVFRPYFGGQCNTFFDSTCLSSFSLSPAAREQ